MEQTYEEVLGQLLMKFANGVDSAIEFGKDQIPGLIQQLLVWKFVWAWVWLIVGIVVVIYMGYEIRKSMMIKNMDDRDRWTAFGEIVLFLIGVIMFFVNLHDILMIHFAPNLYVLEYASDLLNPSDK